jgi:ABC transport system ATP-binding/permease protein
MGWLTIDRRQASILADRYFDVLLGDWRALILLFVQAPLIGALIAGIYGEKNSDDTTLYFLLSLSAFFLGAVNSSREIVKERDIFLRERRQGLSVAAYVVSKLKVQALLMTIECALLVGCVWAAAPMRVFPPVVVIVLLLVGLTGTAAGLLVSAIVSSSDQAVMCVPILVIPQILFSESVLGRDPANWLLTVERLMPVDWGHRLLVELRGDRDLALVLGSPAVLLLTIAVAFVATVAIARKAEES